MRKGIAIAMAENNVESCHLFNCREQENNLERKYELLNRELRAALAVEDWRKSEAQREREGLLLAELVAIVDKRNELVQSLHSQEQA